MAFNRGSVRADGTTESGRDLVVYTAPECTLCKEAWDILVPLAEELGVDLRAVDISGVPELEERYRSLIPVGEYRGRRLFKYRVDTRRVRRIVEEMIEEPPCFLVDEMLGRLARWLRALGHDAARGGESGDDELLERAERENRVLLTRDTRLMERRPIRSGRIEAHLVRYDLVWDQLDQLHEELGLEPRTHPRCLVCNSPLQTLSKEEARPHVPEYVGRVHSDFRLCPRCNRVVWPGTHWDAMQHTLRRLGFRLPSKREV